MSDALLNTDASTDSPAQDQKWYSGIDNADLRGYAELKQWKDAGSVVESYKQLEKLTGLPPERLLRLPDKADSPEWQGIKEKLGFAAPEKPSDYGLPVPEGADPAFAGTAAAAMHSLGLTKAQGVGLAEFMNKAVSDSQNAEALAAQQNSEIEMQSLRKEWGGQFDASTELAKRAVREFGAIAGVDASSLSAMEGAMGTANFMKMWAAIGSKSGEAAFVDGGDAGSGRFGLSPEAAKARIAQLSQDQDWFKRWSAGDVRAQDEWGRLNRIAAGA